MKKKLFRFAAALLALIILAAAIPASAASEQITLVAVNDSLPYELEASTMAFYTGGSYYVPYTVFENSELEIYSSYNNTDKVLTLYNRVNSITFYLNSLSAYDSAGIKYTTTALSKNGIVFVPVSFLCDKFLLGCTVTVNTRYTVIRITNGNQRYINDEFLWQARTLINTKIEKYTEALKAADTGTPGNTGGAQGPTDVTTAHGTATAVIWVDVGSGNEENINQVFSSLAKHTVSAVFFLDASTKYDGDFLRRIYASGNRIGFRVSDLDVLEDAETRLFDAVRTTTRYVYYTGAEDIAALGYINCVWDKSYFEFVYASSIAASLVADETAIIRFDLSQDSVKMLGSLLTFHLGAEDVEITYSGLRETMLE